MDFRKFFTPKIILPLILLTALFLRVWQIDRVPVSLFGDELDLGYQAYSILKTGKDYYGNPFPIHFHSLAEWRTPLYLYSAVPTVAIFGITPLGVRLPAIIFGVLGIYVFYLLVKKLFQNLPTQSGENLALISAAVLTFSPWHIQYSRGGFEVTQLLFFLLLGLLFFFKSLKEGKYLWLSAASFALTPWIYSTAKLFTPLLILFLFISWRKEIISLSKTYLIWAVIAFAIVGGPIAFNTITGGGAERFGYISVFTDKTIEPIVGKARQMDALIRGEDWVNAKATPMDKLFHNKFTFWGEQILTNYLHTFSTDFLFINGDHNLRHSIEGMGMFYRIEIIPLLVGVVLFFTSKTDRKYKLLIGFWILAGVIPSAITRDGGYHATRLILILPPTAFLIGYGLLHGLSLLGKKYRPIIAGIYLILFGLCFVSYQHLYWTHNQIESEKWWHSGFEESIKSIKNIEADYDRVVISTANEPPWVFFAAWYQYPPDRWQKEFPIGNDIELPGFGKVSHTDKFYFGSPEGELYDWGKVLDKKTLYLATQKEVKIDLIKEPERTPGDLNLIKAVAYPSGEPAYYLFTKK